MSCLGCFLSETLKGRNEDAVRAALSQMKEQLLSISGQIQNGASQGMFCHIPITQT